jgi:AcrR family transcriptional regulator
MCAKPEVVIGNNVVSDHTDVKHSCQAPLPMTDRPYHHGNLRTALLEQAARTVRQHGVDELSLRELARQVGVSHSAPRRHFADLQALHTALAEDGFVRLGDELRTAIERAGPDFAVRLRAAAAAYIRFATSEAAMLELMFATKQHENTRTLHDATDLAFAPLLELIREGQAAGVLDQGNPERVGLLLFATVQGIAALVTSGIIQTEQVDELVADANAHFLRTGL